MEKLGSTVRFGVFEADFRTQELRKEGVRVKLPQQSFQILQMLLERPGELVTRDELRQAVWPGDTFVDFDHGVNNSIKRIRDAVGDSAESPPGWVIASSLRSKRGTQRTPEQLYSAQKHPPPEQSELRQKVPRAVMGCGQRSWLPPWLPLSRCLSLSV